MDGMTAVQSRIGEIQARLSTLPGMVASSSASSSASSASSSSWAGAAAAAGLTGTSSTAATTSTPGTTSTGGSAVVAAAQRYLGVPYRWGGTDPSTGLDCSGLTQRVYRDLGVDLPRTSSQQATAGRAVASLDDAQPGDLVFFDWSGSRPGIDHVGIYVGDGKMIAAPQEGDVVKVQDVGRPSVIRRVLPDAPAATAASGTGSLAGVPYAGLFASAGQRHGVDPALLAGVARTESGFDASAVSPAGARGLMQFMPATARGLGVDPLDPSSAVDGAARYLASLQQQFGSTDLALAAYNAGPAAVRAAGGVPAYRETQDYVRAVTTAAERYR